MREDTGLVFTIGHSSRTVEEFAEMLRGARIDCLIDVRRFPRSRGNPQFNIETLPERLVPYAIGYEHWPALGGRRGKEDALAAPVNGFWENRSFHNYADYALSAPFQAALAALVLRVEAEVVALMCSEATWWRCHRRIIADHLLARGLKVRHIMDKGSVEAEMTPGAMVAKDGLVTYPSSEG